MKFIIRGQKLEVTESIKSYIEEKIGKLDKYFENPEELTATVVVRVRGKEQIVEVTVPSKKVILRAEESNEDLYASIDLVSDKLERQIRKNKTKIRSKKSKANYESFIVDFEVEKEEENENLIVKRKELDTKPMSEEEAVLQMELVGHPFFIFKNATTDNISVVYKRKDGNYGIIDTK
ncbi:MAG: ribosome-associated translation inhibitor RaiA [Bacilli bacterium]|nr:ribosome-associated translation inhibitor RaiA [Bacilli bacterium]